MKLSSLRIDQNKKNKGAWHSYAPGVRLLIAMEENEHSVAAARRLMEPHRVAFAAGSIDEDAFKRLSKEVSVAVVAETMLLGWEGLENDDGTKMEYSVAKAIEVLSNPEYEEFLNWIIAASRRTAAYRVAATEKTLGNSQTA